MTIIDMITIADYDSKRFEMKHSLLLVLSILRGLIWLAVGINIAIEAAEVYLLKDAYHLAASAIFFLFANLQLSFCRLMFSMEDEETAKSFLYISIFMICAAIIKVVDPGIDMALIKLEKSNYKFLFVLTSIFEFLLGSLSTLLAGYSMDQFFVLIRKKVKDLLNDEASQ